MQTYTTAVGDSVDLARKAIAEAMAYRFPKYPVRFENIEDDPHVLGVGVFAVPSAELVKVQDFVFGLELSVALPDGWEILPLVRDPQATRVHYADVLSNWSAPGTYYLPIAGVTGAVECSHVLQSMQSVGFENLNKVGVSWTPLQPLRPYPPARPLAADTELAMAA